jgi:mono/diheme cytochrome c family protein
MRITTLLLLTMPFLIGCMPGPKSGQGFTLPDGDAEQGQKTFVQLQCQACHTVKGIELEKPEGTEAERMIALGGDTTYVRTYGSLVTSIINPSHRFALGHNQDEIKTAEGESKMRLYNDEMTVTQLMDLVAFLQGQYTVQPYQPTPYMPYH